MTSLHQLAEENNLPLHQNLDTETLEWIKNNKPEELVNLDYSDIINSIDIDKISRFTPIHNWFTSKDKVNSLHGIRHLMRVVTYSYYLSSSIKSDSGRNSLLLASLLHDIRRNDDKGDEGHAGRATEWYLKHDNEVHKELNLTDIDSNIIIELIKEHERPSSPKSELLSILKTADALDRYVQPKKKWWIDEEYLELKPSMELKAFAFDLVVKSEEKYLRGVDSKDSIISSLIEMKS